uniref:Uncharacterized protein n=1 Tax=Arundo donax TaxID=35708 RepID=A0A0A9AUP8_ARUDO
MTSVKLIQKDNKKTMKKS